jgi:phosphoribosylglycinamide formyltransferase-1
LEAVRQLEKYEIDLVAMAGFMTILGPEIFENFQDRILNTHPSLLPKFKGATAVLDALGSGDTQTGCTIHIATTKLDAGRILAQARVPILPGDTPELLHERIKQSERTLYPEAILVCMARRKRN